MIHLVLDQLHSWEHVGQAFEHKVSFLRSCPEEGHLCSKVFLTSLPSIYFRTPLYMQVKAWWDVIYNPYNCAYCHATCTPAAGSPGGGGGERNDTGQLGFQIWGCTGFPCNWESCQLMGLPATEAHAPAAGSQVQLAVLRLWGTREPRHMGAPISWLGSQAQGRMVICSINCVIESTYEVITNI